MSVATRALRPVWAWREPAEIAQGEAELEWFRSLGPEEYDLRPSRHCDWRQVERCLAWRDIRDAVREGGYVVERRVERTSGCELVVLLLMFWRRGGQPLHVVVQFERALPTQWVVRTAYDPRTRPETWWAVDGYEVRHSPWRVTLQGRRLIHGAREA